MNIRDLFSDSPFSQIDTFRKVFLLGIAVSITTTLLIEGYNALMGGVVINVQKVTVTLFVTFLGGVAVGLFKKIRYEIIHNRHL